MIKDTFLDFILDQLSPLGDIDPRRMFGGTGIYRAGVFFAILSKGRLYFKTDPATRQRYLDEGMQPFQPNAKITLKSYYEVPPSVLENRQQIVEWATEAIAAQQRESP
ncbi:MAG: TfoX/Sxy family protein [Rhodanobacteraceae bacterium]